MPNYNFKIEELSFTVSGSTKTIQLKLSGNNFPEPTQKNGSVNGGNLVFDLATSGSPTVSSFVFDYSGSGWTTGKFTFDNYPTGYTGVLLSGDAMAANGSGDFELVDFELKKDDATADKKRLKTKIRTRHGVSQEYHISSFKLAQINLTGTLQWAAVIEVVQSSTSNLQGMCADAIDFTDIDNILPLVVKNTSDGDSLEVIAKMYIHD